VTDPCGTTQGCGGVLESFAGSPTSLYYSSYITLPSDLIEQMPDCADSFSSSGIITSTQVSVGAGNQSCTNNGSFAYYGVGWSASIVRAKAISTTFDNIPYNILADPPIYDDNVFNGYPPVVLQGDDSVACAFWVIFEYDILVDGYSYGDGGGGFAVGPFSESGLRGGVTLPDWYIGRGKYVSFGLNVS
jgi:hypothetical protein